MHVYVGHDARMSANKNRTILSKKQVYETSTMVSTSTAFHLIIAQSAFTNSNIKHAFCTPIITYQYCISTTTQLGHNSTNTVSYSTLHQESTLINAICLFFRARSETPFRQSAFQPNQNLPYLISPPTTLLQSHL